MTDRRVARTSVPAWYWIVALAALLFELIGCYNYYLHATTDVGTLALDQRQLRGAIPGWMEWAFEISVGIGFVAAVLLLLRRRLAITLLLISLLAMLILVGGLFLVPQLRAMISSDELLGPLLMALIAYGLWHFARMANRRGWLA